jgi:hypothetical protein
MAIRDLPPRSTADHPSLWRRRERRAVVLPLRLPADRYTELGSLPPDEDHPKAS